MKLPTAASLRIPSVAALYAAVSVLLSQQGAAIPPEGTEPTITEETFRAKAKAGETIRDQVIPAKWLNARTVNSALPRLSELGLVTLEDCRVRGSIELYKGSYFIQLTLRRVIVEGSVSISNTEERTPLSWDHVEVQGGVTLAFFKLGPPGTEVEWGNVTVRDEVTMFGGSAGGHIELKQVTIGGNCTLAGFGPEPLNFYFDNGEIGGDLVVIENGGAHRPSLHEHGVLLHEDSLSIHRTPELLNGSATVPAPDRRSEFSLVSRGLAVRGRTIFRDASFEVLDLDWPGAGELKPFQSTGRAYFERVRSARAHLTHAIFKQEVRFTECDFRELWLDEAIFEKEVSFFRTTFGAPLSKEFAHPPRANLGARGQFLRGGLSVEDTRFEGKLRLAWEQVQKPGSAWATEPVCITGWKAGGITTVDWSNAEPARASVQAWDNLHEVWLASGNTEAANEADYWSKSTESQGRSMSLWVWGFGYRPIRSLLWLGTVLLGFAAAYYSRMPRTVPLFGLAKGTGATLPCPQVPQLSWQRFAAALRLSVAVGLPLKWTDAWEKTHGEGRVLALAEWAAVKILLLLFAKALANTSPLLKEITDKLMPFS